MCSPRMKGLNFVKKNTYGKIPQNSASIFKLNTFTQNHLVIKAKIYNGKNVGGGTNGILSFQVER